MDLHEKKFVESIENKSTLLLQKHEQYLDILVPVLNSIHGVNFSIRFWNILMGAWLIKMLASVYDKYLTLSNSSVEWRDNSRKPRLISKKIPHFWRIVAHEPFEFLTEWNLYLTDNVKYWGKSIRNAGLLVDEELCFDSDKGSSYWEQKVERSKLQVWAALFKRKNRFKEIGITTDFHHFLKQDINLDLSEHLLKSENVLFIEDWKNLFSYNFVPDNEVRNHLRLRLINHFHELDEFDKIFLLTLVEIFPVDYLEGFTHRLFLSNLAKTCRLKVCIVFHDLFHQVNINFFVAGQVEFNRSRLIEIGHGGPTFTRGNLLRLWGHEVIDKFVTTGNSIIISEKKDKAFYALKSLNLPTTYKGVSGIVLRALYASSTYTFHTNFFIGVLPEFIFPEKYLLGMQDFINHFLIRKDHFLEWRPYTARMNRQDGHVERILEGVENKLQSRLSVYTRDTFYSRLELVDVYVTDHFSTTILEAFTYDIPVVAFWDEIFDDYSVDVRARAIMKKMRQVNILHANATQAAEFLHDKITVQTWWKNQEVVAVKEEFKELFYRTSPHTLSSFVNFILSSPSLN